LLGIAAVPETPRETGMLIVVGGPQYRAGSHRQFTLLARQLAGNGIASMRFDCRGMGDSEGEMQTFESLDIDIKAAIDTFLMRVTEVRSVVIWGLCDAASAALFYAHTDARVRGLVLLNPWVHTEGTASRVRLRHYYLSRLMQRSFWEKLLSGKIALRNSVGELTRSARGMMGEVGDGSAPANPLHGSHGYVDRMLRGLQRFRGGVLFILSGKDLTAQEFEDVISRNGQWKTACASPRVTWKRLQEANHTFSSRIWRDEVEQWTTRWIKDEQ
jgi:uncharacterized protein